MELKVNKFGYKILKENHFDLSIGLRILLKIINSVKTSEDLNMINAPKAHLKLVYKHALISFLLILTYISISFIVINDASCIYYVIPIFFVFLLVNLIWEAYQTNKTASIIFFLFIIFILYANLTTRKEHQHLKNLLEIVRVDSSNGFTNYDNMVFIEKPDPKPKLTNFENLANSSGYNIFFVETNLEHTTLTTKQMCAVESAALHNRNANVFVVSIRAVLNETLLFKTYKNFIWLRLLPNEIFSDTPLLQWWLSAKVFKSVYMTAHLSDAVRLALLWKFGGFYSDLDTITIKSFEPLLKYEGAGYIHSKSAPSLANGFLHFNAKHPFLKLVMEKFANDYNPSIWGINGPVLLRKTMETFCNVDNVYEKLALANVKQFRDDLNETTAANTTVSNKISASILSTLTTLSFTPSLSAPALQKPKQNCNIYVYPQDYFYPYNNYQLTYLFDKKAMLNVSAFINTYSVHFYGKVSSKHLVRFKDDSVYQHFASSNCEITYSDVRKRKTIFM